MLLKLRKKQLHYCRCVLFHQIFVFACSYNNGIADITMTIAERSDEEIRFEVLRFIMGSTNIAVFVRLIIVDHSFCIRKLAATWNRSIVETGRLLG